MLTATTEHIDAFAQVAAFVAFLSLLVLFISTVVLAAARISGEWRNFSPVTQKLIEDAVYYSGGITVIGFAGAMLL